jgi:TRAP-type mannitol/chloroaromatic compound transport system substrate-binding protein
LKYAAQAAAIKATAFYEGESGRAIERFISKGTEIVKMDDASLEKLEDLAGQYCVQQAKTSVFYARMLKSQMDFLKEYSDWRDMSGAFKNGRTPKYVNMVLGELEKLGYK